MIVDRQGRRFRNLRISLTAACNYACTYCVPDGKRLVAAQDELGIPQGTIRATVLIETITAAFQMEEILYQLRNHAAGLNAGRWDYIFSIIKNFRDRGAEFVLPDRSEVTMTQPMMRAYTEQLVRACHRRGASAIGGMSAVIPDRRNEEANAAALASADASFVFGTATASTSVP